MLSDEERRVLDAASEEIRALLARFGRLRPVIVFDMAENQVGAWPAAEFREGLSDRSRILFDEDRKVAESSGGILVFFRDSARRTLRSTILDAPADSGG